MKVSLNKIRYANKHYETPDLVPDGLDKLIEKIGAQLGAVEEVISLVGKYENITVVKVVSCEKHPDADKLSVCLIDDGQFFHGVERNKDHLIQVVCGAPNVRAGMLAAWIPPEAVVPSTFNKDPFVLETREIRGQKSNGMLASPKELDLGDSHEGILEVDEKVQPGVPFEEAYRLEDEAIIDIENKMFTHRPDCFGIMGVTREIAGIQGKPFKSPDWYTPTPKLPTVDGEQLKMNIKNELPELVPRFTAAVMSGIEVKPSPVWLQIGLSEVGIKPINNIVDYTNFWMLETAQPLHAYDYDKVKALSHGEPAIVIRKPKKGEKIKLLGGKEIEPRGEAIMIATDKKLIGVGGVMGGSETGVDKNTKNIILECANFDMYSVRRTSMAHGLFTDAVTRFTKGQSPLQNMPVLLKMIESVQKNAGGKVAGELIDNNHAKSQAAKVKTTPKFVNDRLGLKLSAGEMKKILENVEITVEISGDSLAITAPFWRTDIEIPEDVVEEIGRLYGYDRLPQELPKRDLTSATKNPPLELKSDIRDRLSKAGANEVLTYSFVPGSLLDKAGQDKSQAYQISNALSPDLQYYRISLIPSLLDKVHPNIKAGYDEFALFELGKTHSLAHKTDSDGLPREFDSIALAVTANNKLKRAGAAYYEAKKYLSALTDAELEFKPIPKNMRDYQVVMPYDLNRSALVSAKGGDLLGLIGEFKPSVRNSLKLPKYSAGFEIDLAELQKVASAGDNYVPLPRYPKVSQDITLKVPADLAYQQLFDFTRDEITKLQPKNTLPTLSGRDIFQRDADKEHKQVTLRLEIASYDRTLTDKEVNKLLDDIAAAAKAKFGAERV